MSFELKLAWKYFRERRRSLTRFTSIAAIAGIAAGVASLILANALARGFNDEMQDKILANTAHVSVFSADGAKIHNWQAIQTNLRRLENVRQISPTTYESAVISGAQTSAYAILRIVPNDSQIQDSNSGKIEISLGKELAEKTDLKIGDQAEIITLENEAAPKNSKVIVKEIFQTGLYEYDSTWIRLSRENFTRLKKEQNFVPTILSVSVTDIYAADKTAEQIRLVLGADFKVIDWQEANQPLFAALSLERKVALAIISLIIFIAALNITTTLALLVNERRLDIAVLRTCGAKTRALVSIFVFEGLFTGVSGILLGVVFGLLGCFAGNYFKVINLSKEVYSLDYIPFHPNPFAVLLIILIAFLLCLAATAYPALKASKIKPLENLRAQ
jgi:lipoprotein-releasing system permease protein